jgi:N-acetylglucosamine malate deacetylase 1
MKTLLAAMSHPDDEVGCAGTLAVHTAQGHRVVLLFLTRGEMTESLGPLPSGEVARLREAHAHEVAGMLDVEVELLDFPDTRVEATAEANHRVAGVIARVRPDAVITWGDAWVRGMRHPDHHATGLIVRGAITLARIARAVRPAAPHREPAPVFAIRDVHSTLPAAVVNFEPYVPEIVKVAAFYRERVGWPDEAWLLDRLRRAGAPHGLAAAEAFDAWETPGGVATTLV